MSNWTQTLMNAGHSNDDPTGPFTVQKLQHLETGWHYCSPSSLVALRETSGKEIWSTALPTGYGDDEVPPAMYDGKVIWH